MTKILVVEDEATIRKGIKIWLNKSGYEIQEAENGEVAIELIKKNNYDLIILDVMMPLVDGYGVLHYIRNESKSWIPVIMLSAKSDEEDKILGLDLGADDYITKPFSNRELEARISASLRKYKTVTTNEPIKTSLFEINQQKYLLKRDGKTVELTRKEMDLLKKLISNEGNFTSKLSMLEEVWGYLDTDDTRTLDIHISKLRRKLAQIGVENVIVTKRGVGYGYVEHE